MKSISIIVLVGFLSLILIINISSARIAPGEYQQDVLRNKIVSELAKFLVDRSKETPASTRKGRCHISSSRTFAPRHNFAIYNDDDVKLKLKRGYGKDLKLMPNLSAHGDGIEFKEKRSYNKDFEPTFNVTTYGGDDKLEEKKSYSKDFEPKPNILTNGKDDKLKGKESYIKNFELTPNMLAHDYGNLKEKESYDKDFIPRLSVAIYQK